MADWRPPITKDPVFNEAMRIAFDYIYELRGTPAPAVIQPGNNNNNNGTIPVSYISPGNGGGNNNAVPLVIVDTHSNRNAVHPAFSQPIGALYYETDRTVWYVVVGPSPVWIYAGSEMKCPQASLPADLGANDRYFVARVAEPYGHKLVWGNANNSGNYAAGWDWEDPGDPSGRIAPFLVNPGNGWALCDGNNATYLLSTGNTATQTLPDLVSGANNAAYLKFGSPANATPNAATAPTLTMNSYTPTGNVSAPTFTGNAATTSSNTAGTPTGNVSAPTFTGNNQTFSTVDVTPGIGVPVFTGPNPYTPTGNVSAPAFTGDALAAHNHTVTITGNLSAPVFTGNAATLTGTISNNGEPRNVVLRPYFRL